METLRATPSDQSARSQRWLRALATWLVPCALGCSSANAPAGALGEAGGAGMTQAGQSGATRQPAAAGQADMVATSARDAGAPAASAADSGAIAAPTAGAAADPTPPAAGSGGAGGAGSSPVATVPEICEPLAAGEQLAFPGAEGFGRLARGGRGGDVCHVTQLGDSGPGSLRDCVSRGDRTVVFEVGGWITLEGNLGITVNNLTIAGQTAPGGGVGVRGTKLSIGGQHIVLRFVRVRRGTITTTDRNDAMAISSTASQVIVDHCSIGFGTDENLSMPGDEPVGPRDVSLQWSIVAWGLQRNNHSAGSLLTASNTTIHHSIYAFNGTRNPKARSEDGRPLDFVNNVIYGWNAPDPLGEQQGWDISQQPFLLADTSNGMHVANAVGNYFVGHGTRKADKAFVAGAKDEAGMPTYSLYFEGNLLDGNANGQLDVSSSDWSMVSTANQLQARITAPRVCSTDARLAYDAVLARAGAALPQRDEVDAALIDRIATQGGEKLHDESDLGFGAEGYGELAAGQAPDDVDRDGMADAWERAHGLDPSNAADRNDDADGDGYTNLEAYLNELAAPAFAP